MGDGVSSRRLLVEFREYFSPALVASGVELQVPRLRYPGFPVEVGGVGELHAACFNGKPHTRTLVRSAGRKFGYASVPRYAPRHAG
jgi:hypothetical protein